MISFPSPLFKESWPFVIIAIVSHSVSYYSFQAILLMNLRFKFHQTNEDVKIVTWIYDTLYYAFLGIGAVIQELQTDKYSGILRLIFLLNVTYLFFYMSKYLLLVEICYMAIAAISGTLKVGLIAYGASDFNGPNCRRALSYFAFTYVIEKIGHFIALRFLPLAMLMKQVCGQLNCSHYVMVITIVFEMIAWISFSCVNTKAQKSVKPNCAKLPPMGRTLAVFLPFLIVWINFGDGVWRWMLQARLMNCRLFWFNLGAPDMLHIDLIALVLCGLIFIKFTSFNWIVTKPEIMTEIGGAFMTIGLIASFYLYAMLQKQNNSNVATNGSSMYFTAYCNDDPSANLTIYINSSQAYHSRLNIPYVDLNIDGHKACNNINVTSQVASVPTSITSDILCLRKNQTYMLDIKCLTIPFSSTFYYKVLPFQFDITRDVYRRPKVCIASTGSTYASNFHIKLQEVHQPNAPLMVVMSNDNFTCSTVPEGQYSLLINYSKPAALQHMKLSYGGVYLIRTYGNLTQTVDEIQKPLKITVWYLMPSIFFVAFGRNCIIVTGMYVINGQSPPGVRTIALGAWWLYVLSGKFIFTISDGIYGHVQNRSNFMVTGVLVCVMTFIFLCLACLSQWNFTCNATTIDEELGISPLALRRHKPLYIYD